MENNLVYECLIWKDIGYRPSDLTRRKSLVLCRIALGQIAYLHHTRGTGTKRLPIREQRTEDRWLAVFIDELDF